MRRPERCARLAGGLTMPVAKRRDEWFDTLLASGAETAQVRWDQAVAA